MTHKFNVKEMHRLDSPERRKILPPKETLLNAGLVNNDVLIDIGCGIGYFSIPASKIVGPGGNVYALDTSDEMLEELKRRMIENKIKNIIPILTKDYDFGIGPNTGTFALMSNVLHEVDDKIPFLKEANRILKKEGTFCIIEWQKKETERGPPLEERLDESEVEDLLKQTHFKLIDNYPVAEELAVYISKKI